MCSVIFSGFKGNGSNWQQCNKQQWKMSAKLSWKHLKFRLDLLLAKVWPDWSLRNIIAYLFFMYFISESFVCDFAWSLHSSDLHQHINSDQQVYHRQDGVRGTEEGFYRGGFVLGVCSYPIILWRSSSRVHWTSRNKFLCDYLVTTLGRSDAAAMAAVAASAHPHQCYLTLLLLHLHFYYMCTEDKSPRLHVSLRGKLVTSTPHIHIMIGCTFKFTINAFTELLFLHWNSYMFLLNNIRLYSW